jgi:hypothetical protein
LLEAITAVDDRLGPVPLPATSLTPGASMTAALTKTVMLADLPGPLVNTVDVTADGGDISAQATAQATVEVIHAAFLMSKTVGIDGIQPLCTGATTLKVPSGTTVVYCYTVQNTGDVPLTNHTLLDSHLGLLLAGLDLTLPPDASYTHMVTEVVTISTTNVATWTATAVDETAAVQAAQAGDITVAILAQATIIISDDNDDADGDTIPDNLEGSDDVDGDNLPNFQDPDSDGDGMLDQNEVGPDPSNPLDRDNDGIPDYLDDHVPTALDEDDQPDRPTQPPRLFLPLMAR